MQCRRCKRRRFDPCIWSCWEDPLKKEMATDSIFLPGKSHRERSLVGYILWSHKESDSTEHARTHLFLCVFMCVYIHMIYNYNFCVYIYIYMCICVLVVQFCPAPCSHTDCSPPGSSVHGIFQTRILEWISIPFSKGSSQPRNQTWVSCIAGKLFTDWASREGLKGWL